MKDYGFLAFIRDIGKHITVNYMMSKDSVKKRLQPIRSLGPLPLFSHQLLQGYDFHFIGTTTVASQMGGSDQWG